MINKILFILIFFFINISISFSDEYFVTLRNNTKYHNFFNGGEQDRIHLVACMLEDRFN